METSATVSLATLVEEKETVDLTMITTVKMAGLSMETAYATMDSITETEDAFQATTNVDKIATETSSTSAFVLLDSSEKTENARLELFARLTVVLTTKESANAGPTIESTTESAARNALQAKSSLMVNAPRLAESMKSLTLAQENANVSRASEATAEFAADVLLTFSF